MSPPTHKVIVHRHAQADLQQYYAFVLNNTIETTERLGGLLRSYRRAA